MLKLKDIQDRDFTLVLYSDLKQQSGSDRPHNSGAFYDFVSRLGRESHADPQSKLVNHRAEVIAHNGKVIAIARKYLPSVLGLDCSILDDDFRKSDLSLEWFRRPFTYSVDAIRCRVRNVPRFYLINPKHGEAILPAFCHEFSAR